MNEVLEQEAGAQLFHFRLPRFVQISEFIFAAQRDQGVGDTEPGQCRQGRVPDPFRQRGLVRVIEQEDNRNFTIFLRPALPLVVALSRMYRGMHHPTDVMIGALFGLACLFVAAKVVATTSKVLVEKRELEASQGEVRTTA